jgi:hypothetical protein
VRAPADAPTTRPDRRNEIALNLLASGSVTHLLASDRALAFERGLTAFGASSMMRSPLGARLVSSRLSRGAYGLGKAAAFTLVILAFAPGWQPALGTALAWLALGCVYGTVVLCVVRGVPVLVEARRLLAPERAD